MMHLRLALIGMVLLLVISIYGLETKPNIFRNTHLLPRLFKAATPKIEPTTLEETPVVEKLRQRVQLLSPRRTTKTENQTALPNAEEILSQEGTNNGPILVISQPQPGQEYVSFSSGHQFSKPLYPQVIRDSLLTKKFAMIRASTPTPTSTTVQNLEKEENLSSDTKTPEKLVLQIPTNDNIHQEVIISTHENVTTNLPPLKLVEHFFIKRQESESGKPLDDESINIKTEEITEWTAITDDPSFLEITTNEPEIMNVFINSPPNLPAIKLELEEIVNLESNLTNIESNEPFLQNNESLLSNIEILVPNGKKLANSNSNSLYGKYFEESDLKFGKGTNEEQKNLLPSETEQKTKSKIEIKEVNGQMYEYEYIYYYDDYPQYIDEDNIDVEANEDESLLGKTSQTSLDIQPEQASTSPSPVIIDDSVSQPILSSQEAFENQNINNLNEEEVEISHQTSLLNEHDVEASPQTSFQLNKQEVDASPRKLSRLNEPEVGTSLQTTFQLNEKEVVVSPRTTSRLNKQEVEIVSPRTTLRLNRQELEITTHPTTSKLGKQDVEVSPQTTSRGRKTFAHQTELNEINNIDSAVRKVTVEEEKLPQNTRFPPRSTTTLAPPLNKKIIEEDIFEEDFVHENNGHVNIPASQNFEKESGGRIANVKDDLNAEFDSFIDDTTYDELDVTASPIESVRGIDENEKIGKDDILYEFDDYDLTLERTTILPGQVDGETEVPLDNKDDFDYETSSVSSFLGSVTEPFESPVQETQAEPGPQITQIAEEPISKISSGTLNVQPISRTSTVIPTSQPITEATDSASSTKTRDRGHQRFLPRSRFDSKTTTQPATEESDINESNVTPLKSGFSRSKMPKISQGERETDDQNKSKSENTASKPTNTNNNFRVNRFRNNLKPDTNKQEDLEETSITTTTSKPRIQSRLPPRSGTRNRLRGPSTTTPEQTTETTNATESEVSHTPNAEKESDSEISTDNEAISTTTAQPSTSSTTAARGRTANKHRFAIRGKQRTAISSVPDIDLDNLNNTLESKTNDKPDKNHKQTSRPRQSIKLPRLSANRNSKHPSNADEELPEGPSTNEVNNSTLNEEAAPETASSSDKASEHNNKSKNEDIVPVEDKIDNLDTTDTTSESLPASVAPASGGRNRVSRFRGRTGLNTRTTIEKPETEAPTEQKAIIKPLSGGRKRVMRPSSQKKETTTITPSAETHQESENAEEPVIEAILHQSSSTEDVKPSTKEEEESQIVVKEEEQETTEVPAKGPVRISVLQRRRLAGGSPRRS